MEGLTVRQALNIILTDTKAYGTTLNYAVLRCQQAIVAPESEMRVRLLYIIDNITTWRHPRAKEVRDVIKRYIKEAE